MEKHHAGNVMPGNDFDLLAALRADLPGAVHVIPSTGQTDIIATDTSLRQQKARLSRACVQMKLSVMKNTGKSGGLSVPFGDEAGGHRVHIEDFAQAFNPYPEYKYDGVAYHDIASILNVAVSLPAALEFVWRLTFAVVMGNGDMHLKNWPLIDSGTGGKPALAAIYDMLSTIPYIPADRLALSLVGERTFRPLTPTR